MTKYKSEISGHLDILIDNNEDDFDGEITKWQKVMIHGDSEGLKSFANLLLKIADLDQNEISDLPIGAREHIHLIPNIDLSKSSTEIIVGRLDAKETGKFYDRYIARESQ